MTGARNGGGIFVVVRGTPSPGTERLADGLGAAIVGVNTPADVARAADIGARASVVWAHPWTRPTAELCRSIADLFSTPSARIAQVRRRLVWREGSLSLGRALVASTPGSVSLAGDRPIARDQAAVTELAAELLLDAPASLEAHLAEINADTSLAVGLGCGEDDPPWVRGLLWSPMSFALRALVTARGPRRAALPRIALEAYRQTLFTAKLWERIRSPAFASPKAVPP
jgi:hypothetical protein